MSETKIVYKKRNKKMVPVHKDVAEYCARKSLERREIRKAEALKKKIRQWP